MTEHQSASEFFLCVMVFFTKHHDWQSGTDALVATARIAHHGNRSTCHTCITSRCGGTDDMGKDALAHNSLAKRTTQCFPQLMPIAPLESLSSGVFVEDSCLVDKLNLLEWSGGSKFINHVEIKFFATAFLLSAFC